MGLVNYIVRFLRYMKNGPTEVKNIKAEISYSLPNERLKGKKIIVTGGGRGLGFSMAKRFISEGAQVLISGRDETTLKNSAIELGCKYLCLDVQDISKFDSFMRESFYILGGVDYLVNNAGISLHEGNIMNVTQEQFDAQINTNLRGGYFLSQKFIEYFEKNNQSNGSILFVSSERGCYVDDLPYGLTKSAINSLVQGLVYRVIKKGIRVNAIAPGVTTSDMTGFKSDENLYVSYNVNERVYLPEEVAEIACFLLSDVSRCLSGQILVCNESKSVNAHWR